MSEKKTTREVQDEQIRELLKSGDERAVKAARCALGISRGGGMAMVRARARCAEIIDERTRARRARRKEAK